MKKLSSKIFIGVLLTMVFWGGGETLYAADCSTIASESARANCEIYNANNDGSNPSSIRVDGEEGQWTAYYPDGRITERTLLTDNNNWWLFGEKDTYIERTTLPDGSVAIKNEETARMTYLDAAGNVQARQGSAIDNSSTASTVGGAIKTQIKNGWKTALDIGAGIFAGPWFLSVAAFLGGILAILAGLMSIAGGALDGTIHLSIIGFKSFVESANITASWVIIRDIINICFIFILLYIAIAMIIGNLGIRTKVQLKNVVVGAILINFSMFFASIIIDAGNLLATALYMKILSASPGGLGIWGLTGPIMDGLNLTGLWSVDLIKASGQTNAIFVIILSIIMVGLTLWAFVYGVILFLARNIVLLFLLAVSPIGFIGGTLPWFEKRASEWWSALINQVMIAPFFLFIVYMLVKMIEASDKIQELTATENFWTESKGLDYSTYINAFLIIGILVIGVKTTKKLAGKIGDIAEGAINAGILAAGAALTGGASAWAGRLTGGATRMASRGATTARRGQTLIDRGAALGGTAGARLQRTGQALVARGNRRQDVGNLIDGRTVRDAFTNPNGLGIALTAAKENFLKTTKKETGVDLDFDKYQKKMDKEYEKRYGDIANKIGGKKEREELDILKNIDTNIKSQAEGRHKKANQQAWDLVAAMPNGPAKRAQLDALKAAMKDDVDTNLAQLVAQEMGVNLAAHEAKKAQLTVTIEDKTVDKNRYAAKIKNKKIADVIRSKPTYEAKDKIEDDLARIIKKLNQQQPAQNNPTPP